MVGFRLALEQEKKVYSLLRTAYGEEVPSLHTAVPPVAPQCSSIAVRPQLRGYMCADA